jgi:uncharacterized protein (DUF1330 family)
MTVYQITRIQVSNQAKLEEYGALAAALIESHGGKFLARLAKVTDLDGDADGCIGAVIEWPNRDALQAFIDSDARKNMVSLRDEAGDFDVAIMDGVETAA